MFMSVVPDIVSSLLMLLVEQPETGILWRKCAHFRFHIPQRDTVCPPNSGEELQVRVANLRLVGKMG